jgi:hypothetical protein
MRPYTTRLIALFLGLTIAMAAFVLFVDPYDVLHGPRISGFNAEKTRRDEDGRRVTVGQAVLEGRHGTLLFGNSRAVDGFPREIDAQDWPGGLYDAGMRGSSAFEQARAAILAGRSPDLRCVVMTFDYATFASSLKAKSTYWISALPDGDALRALTRTSLSPHAFWRSVQTISDNIAHRPAPERWPDVYKPGEQRRRTLAGARGYIASYRTFEYDPSRLDFFMRALGSLAERGVQVIGVIEPLHPFNEEAREIDGQEAKADAWRKDVAARFAKLAQFTPRSPCIAPSTGGVLWDFSGFQMTALATPPSETQTAPQPYFYEAAHFTPLVGVAVLDRMQGKALAPPFDFAGFGVRLTPQTAGTRASDAEARRQAWLATDANAQVIEAKLKGWLQSDSPEPRGPRDPLSRDDWIRLDRDVKRVPDRTVP